jgi:hypothetical protein
MGSAGYFQQLVFFGEENITLKKVSIPTRQKKGKWHTWSDLSDYFFTINFD